MKVYKIAWGWAVLIYCLAPVILAAIIFGILDEPKANGEGIWIFIPVYAACILVIVAVRDVIFGKVVINDTRIYVSSTAYYRSLNFNEISGYRVTDKYISIESNQKELKNIRINTYYGNTKEIISWLSARYPDLDVYEALKDKREILTNIDFGGDKFRREERLNRAKKLTVILNWSGAIIGVWTFFFPKPYEYAILISLAMPLICLITMKLSNGLIRINEKKANGYPTVLTGVIVPSTVLVLRVLLDYNLLEYSKVWGLSLLVGILYVVLLVAQNSEFTFEKRENYFVVVFMLLFMTGYGYGAIVALNGLFDNSKPTEFEARVLDKICKQDKVATYKLEIGPWGLETDTFSMMVSKKVYDDVDVNDQLKIYQMGGALGIPWVRIAD